MGQLESVARRLHGAIAASELFGKGNAAKVSMSYAPSQQGLPYAVYDISSLEWDQVTDDPLEQIVSVEATIQIFARSGGACMKLSDELITYLSNNGVVRNATGFRTLSDDYTGGPEAPRGMVRGVFDCDLEIR